MRANEFITESLSSIVYHYTNLSAAAKILDSGQFELSSGAGSIEQHFAPKGYHYFMSTTRTRHGGFHSSPGNGGVIFNIDGTWYNQRYPAKSVDYWGDRGTGANYAGRASEAEDRLFSKTPTIPITGVTSIHVYVKPMDEQGRANWASGFPSWARKVLLSAKLRGIPAYLYEDVDAWKNQDARGRVTITRRETLRGQEKTGFSRKGTNYLEPWLQLINVNKSSLLGEKAKSFAYELSLSNPYYSNYMITSLKTDLSNARKPGSGVTRDAAIKIFNFMSKNNADTVEEFISLLEKKWSDIKKAERN
jgi:hypothetical protein